MKYVYWIRWVHQTFDGRGNPAKWYGFEICWAGVVHQIWLSKRTFYNQ